MTALLDIADLLDSEREFRVRSPLDREIDRLVKEGIPESTFDYSNLKVGDPAYRVVDGFSYSGGIGRPWVHELLVTRVTPAGYWVGYHIDDPLSECRICYNHANKKYAYPDLPSALRSYRRRKESQLKHGKCTMESAEAALAYLKGGE